MQGIGEIRRANKAAANPADKYRVQRDKLVTALIQIVNDPGDAVNLATRAIENFRSGKGNDPN